MLEGDEAKRLAEQLLYDLRNGNEPDGISVYDVLIGRNDGVAIGRHLIGPFTAALTSYAAGDRSPGTARIVAVAMHAEEERKNAAAIAELQRLQELRAKALRFTGNPGLISAMTIDSGIWQIPLPADSVAGNGDSWQTATGTLVELTSFYRDFMAASGWLLDLRNSEPDPAHSRIGHASSMVFALSEPLAWVTISVFDDRSASEHLVIQIFDHDDHEHPTGNWLELTRP